MRKKLLRNAFILALLALAATPAAAKRPKNFRLMWKKAPVAAEPEESTAAVHGPPRVMAGRWTPEVRAALDKFLAERGKGTPGYDPLKPPVAVLPWSDALVAGDPAELVFLRLTTRVDFHFTDEWWEIIPPGQGRQPARAAYEHFIPLSSATWQSQPDYHHYRKTILASYLGLCREVGRRECRQYLMRLWSGWRENEAIDYARQDLADEKSRPGGVELVYEEAGDKSPLRVRRGLRLIPEMRDLAQKLRAAGVDVWIVDDVPQPVLSAGAADYGIDASRVYGIRAAPDGARYSASVLKPVPTRGGKAEIVKASVGRPPDFALGRDAADADLLSYGDGLRVILSGDKELEAKAKEKGWLLQPSLSR
jgi:phosphoserine phosphatase